MSKGNKEEQKWLLGESLNQYDRSLKEELNKVEKRNREQNHKISALINAFDDDYIKKEEENTNISLDYSKEGIVIVDDIKGNTLVNNVKDSNKELVLNGDIDTQGINNITITEGVDGGKVDIALEGNTMVNVCDQEDSIAITKSYEVTTGNHIALQGEYDGKCRPNVYGNTLVNLVDFEKNATNFGGKVSYENEIITLTETEYWASFTGKLPLKVSTKYTLVVNVIENTTGSRIYINNVEEKNSYFENFAWYSTEEMGISKFVVTTKADITDKIYSVRTDGTDKNGNYAKIQLMLLEGDYTNKPIPDYFTGMQSSFEDKLVPENLYKFSSRDDFYLLDNNATLDGEYIKMTANGNYQNAMLKPLGAIKPSTIYTVVVDIVENTLNSNLIIMATKDTITQLSSAQTNLVDTGKTGIFTYAVTTSNDLSGCTRCLANFLNNTNTTGSIKYRIMVVEGDYTNYDFTDYDSTKGGKYKVDYKVTGKNKFDKSKTLDGYEITDVGNGTIGANLNWFVTDFIPVIPNTSYSISGKANGYTVLGYDKNKQLIANFPNEGTSQITIPNNVRYIKLNGLLTQKDTFQLEEGTTATTYEPYKESIKTLYLNSPLLEGDTIEQSGNDIVHMHRYNKVVFDGSDDEVLESITNGGDKYRQGFSLNTNKLPFCKPVTGGIPNLYCDKLCTTTYNNVATSKVEGIALWCSVDNKQQSVAIYKGFSSVEEFRTWLQQNPMTIVYELATPTKEVISTNDNLLLDSYVNGHLDVDSVVPIDKVVFNAIKINCKYWYPSTDYILQFESNSTGIIEKAYTNNIQICNNLTVAKGINKILFTSNTELPYKAIDIYGIGFNASKIVVTPKVDGDFGYFKGMKSVGQNDADGHKIEILSHNKFLGMNDDNITLRSSSSRQGFNKFTIIGSESWNSEVHFDVNSSDVPIGTNIKIRIKVLENTNPSMNNSNLKSWQLTDFNVDNFDYSLLNEWQEIEYNVNKEYTGSANSKLNLMIFGLKNTALPTDRMVAEIEVEINNSKKSNKKEILMNEPLRGLPNGVRDKYVMIDGKWYIERNNIEIVCNGDENWVYSSPVFKLSTTKYPHEEEDNDSSMGWGICDKYSEIRDIIGSKDYAFKIQSQNIQIRNKDFTDVDSFKSHLNSNPITVVYQLETPTYEPIEYNPFEVYTDTTHISNNSLIPANMVIKNTGYNCILKPSTKYTVVTNTQNSISAKIGSTKVNSTNNVFTIITPSTLNDSVLRFSGKGLTTRNIMLLEGDKTNYIPGYFTGMESAFEQELVTDEKDKNYGKYKVTAKVTDGNKENNITFYINEPLRGIGDIKDKIYVKEDKIVVERNCVSYVIEPTQIPSWTSSSNGIYTYNLSVNSPIVNTNCGRVVCNSFPCDVKNAHIRNYANSISTVVDPSVPNGVIRIITDKDPETLKQWLQQNPTTVIYQLAEPIYEEVECDLSKLMLENYENSSLILNSNIPPTVNVRYKGELPIVSATKELSSNVESTTTDINQNIIPYMCDMDYRIVELQLKNASTQGLEVNVLGLDSEDVLLNNRKANKIFNPSYEMLKRDILSERYSSDEYKYRLERYLLADKISNEEYNELEELINGR